MAKTTQTLKQDEFIQEYLNNGGVTLRACQTLTGITYSNARRWLQEDEDFKKRLSEEREQWHERLRAVAMKRATEKSDVLLMFLMKSIKPEIYDDAIRKEKWMAEKGITAHEDQIPIRAILVRDEEPWKAKAIEELAEAKEH